MAFGKAWDAELGLHFWHAELGRPAGNAGTPWDDQQAMLRLYAPVDGFRHLLRAVLALTQEILTQEINNAHVSSVSDSVCVIHTNMVR